MAVAEQITTHTDDAYERLLGQFKDKPIITAVLKAWTDILQTVENDYYSLMSKTLFLNGSGKNLERYGQLFNIYLPDGLTDSEYRELLIAEIMRRSSNGTPNKIREIIEATTGIYNTQFFEHYNAKNTPSVLGCNFMFGYGDEETNNFTLSLETREAKYLKWASPVTTGSCVLGLHTGDPTSLYIPSELTTPLEILGLSSNKTLNPSFDSDLSQWIYTSDKISWLETFEDLEHPDGQLQMDVAGTVEKPQATTLLSDLQSGRQYTISVSHYNSQEYTGRILVGTTPYGDEIGSVTLTGDEVGFITFTPVNINSTYVTLEGNTNEETDYLSQWDNAEVYDTIPKYDQDQLVNAVDDWIAVRQVTTTSSTLSTAYGSGLFAELNGNIEGLQVTNTSTEEFFVKDTDDSDQLFVRPDEELVLDSSNGIFLEISQINYDDDL